MTALRLALLAEGAGDRALLPVLTWTLRALALDVSFFEPRFEAKRGELATEIERVSREEAPDILFVHRDADREPLEVRRQEIPMIRDGLVRVVPVRMTEAWLLIDEVAIRKAAGNPNGRVDLDLPRISRLESLPNPKELLRSLLIGASGHTSPRRRQRFQRDVPRCVQLVAEYIQDYTPLRTLAAFRAFESDLSAALDSDAES